MEPKTLTFELLPLEFTEAVPPPVDQAVTSLWINESRENEKLDSRSRTLKILQQNFVVKMLQQKSCGKHR